MGEATVIDDKWESRKLHWSQRDSEVSNEIKNREYAVLWSSSHW